MAQPTVVKVFIVEPASDATDVKHPRCYNCNGLHHSARFCHQWRREVCIFWKSRGLCDYGDKCKFAHGEQNLNPSPIIMVKPKPRPKPMDFCKWCKKEGHRMKACPKRKCVDCGALDHWYFDCPHMKKSFATLQREAAEEGQFLY